MEKFSNFLDMNDVILKTALKAGEQMNTCICILHYLFAEQKKNVDWSKYSMYDNKKTHHMGMIKLFTANRFLLYNRIMRAKTKRYVAMGLK